jgi:hypothetical protein
MTLSNYYSKEVTLSLATCDVYAECHYADCHVF